MRAIEYRMARKAIGSADYRNRRMEAMGREMAFWVSCENAAKTIRHREFCRGMQRMYLKRYEYYLNVRSG